MDAHQNEVRHDTEELKEISKWTRKYAQNRTLTVLVFMVVIVFFSMVFAAVFAFLLALAAAGFLKGNMVLGCVGTVVLVAGLAVTVKYYIVILKKYGGKNKGLIDQIVGQRIYGKEGAASMPMPQLSKKMKRVDIVVGIVYLVLFLGSMEFAMLGYIPVKYILPLMAVFVVPFGVYMYFIQRPHLGPVLLLFPILYAFHAILILAGVPIFFTGNFATPLNMLLPVVYTFLAYMIGHIYSRYALKKLKTAAHLQEDSNG